ncbi:MAG: hypothetical protein ABIT96_09425 [Ferruginibacter sp.]
MNKSLQYSFIVCCMVLLFSCKKSASNNPANTTFSTSTPLIDFGTGTYRGYTGGLYANGSNTRPATHEAAGLSIASNIHPLNAAGQVDDTNGKIVWISIGMSNATQEARAFLTLVQSFPDKNPKLTLLDCAVGGQDIVILNNAASPYWDSVFNRLSVAGITPAQVQVIWFLEAEANPSDTAFSTYPDGLKAKYKSVMQILKSKLPNLKLSYLSDRIYAGYATSSLNPEPYAWYAGWVVKRLIADQVSGDAGLRFAGTNPPAAWLSWGPYLWAKGSTPRSDGLVWLPGDYQSDGTHPSTSGRQKVAQMLLQFFSTDATTKPWFLKP